MPTDPPRFTYPRTFIWIRPEDRTKWRIVCKAPNEPATMQKIWGLRLIGKPKPLEGSEY